MLKLLLTFVTLTLPFLAHSFSPDHPTDRRVLVLLDDLAVKSSHSLFFKTLQSRGFDLDFKLADDPKIGLQRYGQYNYDALILFSPTVDRKSRSPRVLFSEKIVDVDQFEFKLLDFASICELRKDLFWQWCYGSCDVGFGGSIDLAAILDFVDSGHDLIIAADTNASDLIRQISVECGVDFDEVSVLSLDISVWFKVFYFAVIYLEFPVSSVCMICTSVKAYVICNDV